MSMQTVFVTDGGSEVTHVSRRNSKNMKHKLFMQEVVHFRILNVKPKKNQTHRSPQYEEGRRFLSLMMVKSRKLL